MGEHTEKEDCADVAPTRLQKTTAGAPAKCNVDQTLKKRAVFEPNGPISLDRDQLSFASVVGRPTTSLAVTVSNRGHLPLLVDSRIEEVKGESNFERVVGYDFVQPHTDDGRETSKELSVRYTPKSAGKHSAVWVITTDKGGEERVDLHGTASSLDAAARTEQAPGDPIPELVDDDSVVSARAKRGELAAALDSLSHLGAYFDASAPPNDKTREEGGGRMIAAVQQLNGDVLHWLAAEGVHEMKASRPDESGAGAIVEAFLMKGVEGGLEHFLDLGGPALAAVMFALELGGAVNEAGSQNSEAHEALGKYTETMHAAYALGVEAQGVATSAVMHRYGSTFGAYGAKRAQAHQIASVEAMGVIGDIQHVAGRQADTSYFYEKAREVVSEFRAAMLGWGAATGAIAAAAVSTETAAAKGYQLLLGRYLAFRVERAKEEQRPKFKELLGAPIDELMPELADLETVIVEGGINFDDPVNIQFDTYRFGGYENMSDSMRMFAGAKMIGALEMPVSIRLFSAQGGSIVIHRTPKEPATFEAKGAAAGYLKNIGNERLWQSVEGVNLFPKVIKVAQ